MTGANYVSISRRALDFEDYIDVARRHVGWIVGPTLGGLVLAIVIANFLPNTYISRAVMQITPATISESIATSVATQQLNDRVVQMQQEILSRNSLSSIINDPRLQLYASDLKRKPLDDVIEQMRNDVKIELASVPGTAGKRASAFTIQFSYSDPQKAQQTVQAFVTKFNEANLNAQRTTTNSVRDFVNSELTQSKANLDQLDEQLTKFRIQNSGRLPEEAQYNMSNLAALQSQMGVISENLAQSERMRLQIDAALSTAKVQLQTAELLNQDNDLSSPTAQKNEDLLTTTRQIKDLDTKISILRQSYRDNYRDLADMISTREVLAKKQEQLQKEQEAEDAKPKVAAKPGKRSNLQMANAISEIKGKIDQYNAQLSGLNLQKTRDQEKLEKVQAEINRIRKRLEETPGIDLTYKAIERQEQNAQKQYQDNLKKQQLAASSEAMISVKAAENLDVLDSPSLPPQPSAPKRPVYYGAGTAFGLIIGFAMAAGREMKDSSLKNLKDVRAYTNMPVLGSIPLLENALLVRRKRRITWLAWSAAAIVSVLMICVSLYYRYAIAT